MSRGVRDRASAALRTAVGLVVLPALIALLAPAGIALGLLGAHPRTVHRLYVLFARAAMAVGATRVEVHGRQRLRAAAAYVVVSNHESAWDPLCLLAGLPELVLRFVVKEAIMRIPLFGHALRATGNLRVVRTHTASDVRSIEEGMGCRDEAVSMLFFAEGTRSRDGALHPFKKGAFATALQHGLPVLPVAIAGTRRIWPKGTLGVRPGRVVVEVGEPLPVQALRLEDRAALREEAFRAVRELRAQARARLRAAGVEPGGID